MEPSLGLGDTLRSLRLQKGLSLDDVAFRTKIRKDYLQALEEGRYDLLPAETYLKGFLVSYAATVERPAKEILQLYHSERPGQEVSEQPSPLAALPNRSTSGPTGRRLVLPLFLVLVLAIGLGLWWFLSLNRAVPVKEEVSVSTQQPAPQKISEPAPLAVDEQLAPSQPAADESATLPQLHVEVVAGAKEAPMEEKPVAPEPVDQVTDVEDLVAEEPTVSHSQPFSSRELVLPQVMQMQAIKPVSVVVAIDGRPVQLYNLQAESLLRWRIRQSVVVEVEHADAVEIFFGETLVSPDDSGRFVFPQEEGRE